MIKDYEELVRKQIKSYIKHFGLKIKNGFLYKGDIAIFTEDLNKRENLLCFLSGISAVLDNKQLWGINENEKV